MTQDLDQTVALVSAFIGLLFALLFAMAWKERSLKAPKVRSTTVHRRSAARRRDSQ